MSTPSPSRRLGPYELIELIGKGGMGEVWRARDPRLGRDVAIKSSSQQFSDRFEREARAIAALNHSNICTLHDVGADYLVMELIEGPTLADRIKEGAIPVDEALNIARQIADALDAAHEKGIVHRDLKPANIKLRPDGSVKVLDFGLAKPAVEEAPITADSPTLLSVSGMILGTAGYMSPEQAKGKTVDKRADIFAFGVVLYEMVTGRQLFRGETISESLASVIKDEPDWAQAPARIQRLLRKCLEKDPKKRLRDIGDWADYLQPEASVTAPSQSRLGTRLWMGIAALSALVAVAIAAIHFRAPGGFVPPTHLAVPVDSNAAVGFLAISHDGRNLVLAGVDLMVRPLDSAQPRHLPNTVFGREPVWSPDGRSIAFLDQRRLKVVSAAGGPAQPLCDKPLGISGAAWNRDGVILAGTIPGETRWMKINASTGACDFVPGNPAIEPFSPDFLPDQNHFIFLGRRHAADLSAGDPTGIYVASLDNFAGKRLLPDDSTAIYAPGLDGRGFLVFTRDGALVGQAFNPASLSLSGDVFTIAEDVSSEPDGAMMAAAAPGVLVYGTGRNYRSQLNWLDRAGKVLSTVGSPAYYEGVALSPDGRQIAFARDFVRSYANIWLRDVARDGETRLTSPALGGMSGIWSPDGKMIAYMGRDNSLYRRDVVGGREESILKSGVTKFPSDWSRDDRYLLFTQSEDIAKGQIWVLPDPGGTPGKPWLFEKKDASVTQAQLSPNGRWVAYTSDESGKPTVYIRPFPSGAGRWKVPEAFAWEPRWRNDGKELYYLTSDSLPRMRLVAAPVAAGASGSFSLGEPRSLFERVLQPWSPELNAWSYAPSPDGQRFLIGVKTDVPETIHVLTNWTQMFAGKK